MGLRASYILLGSFILLFPEKSGYLINDNDTYYNKESFYSYYQEIKTNSKGYKAITRYEDGFIAAGSDGRIDRITASGEIINSQKFPGETFNSILADDKIIIVAGDRGTIMSSSEKGIFSKVESDTKENINSLALFRGKVIAGSDHGEIISGDEKGHFRKIRLALKGNIVSVSARISECYGVTNEGEIIHSVDGITWDITDFNKVYSGYYKPCRFTKVLVTENRVAIAGSNNDGSPALMFSNQGKVWTERPLNYTDEEGEKGFLTEIPYDIMYDELEDNFYIACSKGKLMQLPSCAQCNKLAAVSTADLVGISSNDNVMIIVGGNFLIKTVGLKW